MDIVPVKIVGQGQDEGGTSPLVVTPQPVAVVDRSGTAGVSASV